jgi:hypothetical protein
MRPSRPGKIKKTPEVIRVVLFFLSFLIVPVAARAGDSINLAITDKKLDAFFDMPLDFHQIPKTDVFLSQSPKTADDRGAEKMLGLDIAAITRGILIKQFNGKTEDGGFNISENPDGDSLQITPWVFLQFLDDGRVMLWTVWNVEYMDLYWNKKQWDGYCFAGLSLPRPLEGQDSWTSDGGVAFGRAVEADAQKLLEMTRDDLRGVYQKLPFQSCRMKAVWIFEKKSKELDVNYTPVDSSALMIRSFEDDALRTFLAGGLTGLLLKSVSTSTVLFNGSLILSKQAGEMVPATPTPSPFGEPGR